MKRLGLSELQLSLATLEEVFLSIAAQVSRATSASLVRGLWSL